jgi:hypothetical protein
MSTLSFTLMILTMLAVLGSLIVGVFGMARGGEFNRKYGNKLMQARVFLQAGALGLFVLALLANKK